MQKSFFVVNYIKYYNENISACSKMMISLKDNKLNSLQTYLRGCFWSPKQGREGLQRGYLQGVAA